MPYTEAEPMPVKVMSGGGGGGTLSATAATSAPALSDGASAPLSLKLNGDQRVSDTDATALLQSMLDEMQGTDPAPCYTPGGLFSMAVAVTRPADTTAYAALDLIANSTTAGSVVPLAFDIARFAGEAVRIERVRLRKSGAVLTNASFRVHFFGAAPVPSVGDNGVLEASNVYALADVVGLAGSIDITMDKAAAAGARGVGVPTTGTGITLTPASGTTIYALIQAVGAYTPASGEVFTVVIEGMRA